MKYFSIKTIKVFVMCSAVLLVLLYGCASQSRATNSTLDDLRSKIIWQKTSNIGNSLMKQLRSANMLNLRTRDSTIIFCYITDTKQFVRSVRVLDEPVAFFVSAPLEIALNSQIAGQYIQINIARRVVEEQFDIEATFCNGHSLKVHVMRYSSGSFANLYDNLSPAIASIIIEKRSVSSRQPPMKFSFVLDCSVGKIQDIAKISVLGQLVDLRGSTVTIAGHLQNASMTISGRTLLLPSKPVNRVVKFRTATYDVIQVR